MKNSKTQKIVISAVMIALAAVLSTIKVWEMPLGGSVTLLSMLPIVLISLCYGVKWGLTTSFLYALLQIFLDLGKLMSHGMTPFTLIGSLVFDYLLAYGSLGLAGLFHSQGPAEKCGGIALALVLRFISHVISGSIFYAASCPEGWNVFLYSIVYNGTYMLPELIFTMIAAVLLLRVKSLKRFMANS